MITRFWSLFVRTQGGKLVSYSPDVRTVFARIFEENAEVAMFALALEKAQAAGWQRYEISNYAHPGYACRHNQIYWRNEPYFGFGAGATGYQNGVRRINLRRPTAYIESTGEAVSRAASCSSSRRFHSSRPELASTE